MKNRVLFGSLFLVAALAFGIPAGASGEKDDDDETCQGNCPTTAGSSTSTSSADQEQFQQQDQDQFQQQAQEQGQSQNANANNDNSQSVTVNAVDKYKEAASNAPNLVLAYCQRGVSGQAHIGGGSFGNTDDVCLLFQLATFQTSTGDVDGAAETLERAENILKWRTNKVRVFLQGVPLLGVLF